MNVGDKYIDKPGLNVATVVAISEETATIEIRKRNGSPRYPIVTQLPVRMIEQNRTGWRPLAKDGHK